MSTNYLRDFIKYFSLYLISVDAQACILYYVNYQTAIKNFTIWIFNEFTGSVFSLLAVSGWSL